MRYAYIPAGRDAWLGLAVQLATRYGHSPVIWMGDDRHLARVPELFPECVALSSIDTNLGRFPAGSSRPRLAVPDDIQDSIEFANLRSAALRMMQRQDQSRRYGYLEREAIFHSMGARLWSLIDAVDPEFVLASEMPHSPATLMLAACCEMRGIPLLFFQPVNFAPALIPRTGFGCNSVGPLRDSGPGLDTVGLGDRVMEYCRDVRTADPGISEPEYMRTQRERRRRFAAADHVKVVSSRSRARARNRPDRRTDYQYAPTPAHGAGARARAAVVEARNRVLQHALQREYSQRATLVPSSDYVYVPLHYEPERTSNPEGGRYSDQLRLIERVAQSVTGSTAVIVKEHPSQFHPWMYGYLGRSPEFYRALSDIPNVTLCDMSHPSISLIKGALAVCSLTGTAALEAALLGVPAVAFGNPWFKGCPGVRLYEAEDDLQHLEQIPDAAEVESFLADLVKTHATLGLINPSNEQLYQEDLPLIQEHDDGGGLAEDVATSIERLGDARGGHRRDRSANSWIGEVRPDP